MRSDYFGLILCAGRGSRMRPFTPKEMLPFVNKSIVVHAIDSLKRLGVNRVNIVVGEGKYTVQEHVGTGEPFDVSVSYDFQHLLDGDAGAIRCANTARYSSAGSIVLLFGDTVFSNPGDLLGLKEQFERFKDDPDYAGAICFKRHKAVIPGDSGVFPYGVALIEDELISEIYEKPGPKVLSRFSVDGFCESIAPAYIFKRDCLFSMVEELYSSGVDGEYHLSDAIRLALSKGLKFSGYSIKGSSLDMGRPLPYLRALREWFVNASEGDIVRAAGEWSELASKFKNGF